MGRSKMATSVEKVEACAKELLQLCQDEKMEFFNRLITMDECWVYHYDPETKDMSKQWKHADSPPPKKAKSQP
jgi:hypothetical protein